jgi:hypothetical protein
MASHDNFELANRRAKELQDTLANGKLGGRPKKVSGN